MAAFVAATRSSGARSGAEANCAGAGSAASEALQFAEGTRRRGRLGRMHAIARGDVSLPAALDGHVDGRDGQGVFRNRHLCGGVSYRAGLTPNGQ